MRRGSSGVSLAFFTASWNFLSMSSALFFSASTAWRKIASFRPSCSRMALAADSKSAKVFGLTAAVCAITALVSGSTFNIALQHGHVISNSSDIGFPIGELYVSQPWLTSRIQNHRGKCRVGRRSKASRRREDAQRDFVTILVHEKRPLHVILLHP